MDEVASRGGGPNLVQAWKSPSRPHEGKTHAVWAMNGEASPRTMPGRLHSLHCVIELASYHAAV